ncbi:hypothetical protein ACN6KK_05955 [Enterococcus faecium]
MDITYIPCNDGRLYLSTYIDLATRILRYYMVDSHMKKRLSSVHYKFIKENCLR